MNSHDLKSSLEKAPVIAAIQDNFFEEAIASPVEIIFHLNANLLTVKDRIERAHSADKKIFIHMDLAEGLGKDKVGVQYLLKCNADGIITTRSQLIRIAKDMGLLTIQRFFTLDSKGLGGIHEMVESAKPDMIEIMPGVIGKTIERFSKYSTPVIAGGLIETKSEVTDALYNGAFAVSTGKKELWYI